MAALGAASVAVDLPGHGFDARCPTATWPRPARSGDRSSPLAAVTMEECAESVLTALRQVRHHPTVVLVAHSAGGGPASLAAERAPNSWTGSSTSPRSSPRAARASSTTSPPRERDGARRGPALGDPAELGAVRINPLSTDPPTSRSCGRPTTTTRRRSGSAAGVRR
ncbi:alpha/beta fold hydrolase [Streptomyces sp. M19]